MMFALKSWNDIKPPFGSGLVYELHEKTKGIFHIEMYYKNNTVDNAMGDMWPVTIPG